MSKRSLKIPDQKSLLLILDNGRTYELTDWRQVGTSLFGKLPNGVEIELTNGTPVEYQS